MKTEVTTEPTTDAAPEMSTNEPTEAVTRSEVRYPLAFDAHGNPLKVPAEAVAWRVRRGGGRRGRPRNVFDATTGRQLEIPLGASLENLMETNVAPDRYLLYPIDAAGSILPGLIAVTEVPETDDDEEAPTVETALGLDANSNNPWVAALARHVTTIENLANSHVAQSKEFAAALQSAVGGYAALRPAPHAAPIVVESPAAQPAQTSGGGLLGGVNPEQIGQMLGMLKLALDMFKGAGNAAPTTAGAAIGGSVTNGGVVGVGP